MFHQDFKEVILKNPNLQKKLETQHVLRKDMTHQVKDIDGPVQDCKQLKALFIQKRSQAKLSQADLAKKCNVDKSLINKLEQGNMSLSEAKQICLKAQKWIGQLLSNK